MYMNLKSNKHKIISFNTTTMASSGFIGPPKISDPPLNLAPPPSPQIIFFAQVPPNYFGPKFLGPPLKLGGGEGGRGLLPCQTLRKF